MPLLFLGAAFVFLATRLPVLDADVPNWVLTRYSPIDEFAYAGPAFNLLQYGTWVHQVAAWASPEGLPLNAAQNIVAAVSMGLLGDDYWGLRISSVAFGLIGFLALVGVVRQLGDDARRVDSVPAWLANGVTVAAAILLLVDFSSLVSARVVEPTVTRYAAVAAIMFLVARGSFLGDRRGVIRTLVFGAAVAASVLFVYIYNAFFVPGAFIALLWWTSRGGGGRSAAVHATAFIGGCLLVTVAYFGLVALTYHENPLDWYHVWIGSLSTTARGGGLSISKILSIADANVFRLDPAFLGLFLATLPVFAWRLARRPTATTVLVAAALACFLAQSAFVADYPERKFLMMLLFAVPMVATSILAAAAFRTWVVADRKRTLVAGLYLAAALGVTALAVPLEGAPPHGSNLARIVGVAGIVGVAALAVVAVVRRPAFVAIASAALCVAIVAPLAYADAAYVYRRPTFTYRDAQIDARPVIDDQVTAGGLSFAMQLYNTSRPVLSGYFVGMTRAEYDAAVVRLFSEGLATSMFSYVDAVTRSHLESLGFRLVETYNIILPLGQKLGRYVFGPAASTAPSTGG